MKFPPIQGQKANGLFTVVVDVDAETYFRLKEVAHEKGLQCCQIVRICLRHGVQQIDFSRPDLLLMGAANERQRKSLGKRIARLGY